MAKQKGEVEGGGEGTYEGRKGEERGRWKEVRGKKGGKGRKKGLIASHALVMLWTVF